MWFNFEHVIAAGIAHVLHVVLLRALARASQPGEPHGHTGCASWKEGGWGAARPHHTFPLLPASMSTAKGDTEPAQV